MPGRQKVLLALKWQNLGDFHEIYGNSWNFIKISSFLVFWGQKAHFRSRGTETSIFLVEYQWFRPRHFMQKCKFHQISVNFMKFHEISWILRNFMKFHDFHTFCNFTRKTPSKPLVFLREYWCFVGLLHCDGFPTKMTFSWKTMKIMQVSDFLKIFEVFACAVYGNQSYPRGRTKQ